MIISDKLKRVIFKKMYDDLKGVEIIPFKNSIWFIDRESKYWYFEFKKSGILRWRYFFFESFFLFFSLGSKEYQGILGEWVEEVLNCKVVTTGDGSITPKNAVEEVLNCKVVTTYNGLEHDAFMVEEVLKS